LGWFASASCCEVAEAEDQGEIRWVRTANGWERAGWLREEREEPVVPLHPATVAAAMFVLSAGCLVSGHARGKKSNERAAAIELLAREDRL
jgi:hypothetical protein